MSRADEAVAAALALLETEGEDAVTMRRVAERVGVRAPSLYKHVAGRDDLIAALQAEGLRAMGAAFREALADSPPEESPLAALARGYRELARRRPALYRVTTGQRLLRMRLPPGLEDEVGGALAAALGGDGDLARAAWAFAHGMADLELNARFPDGADLDRAWQIGVRALDAAAARRARAAR
ncbi:MAG: WHG domain-containing protein [Myxococcales bacterium]|nr:WHG domain-containing protein [Myxococcales bacterium]MCB9734961.1 WHG domain-containing protein [Deltaproteobacteria bacterium]